MRPPKPMHGTTKARGCDHLRLGNFCRLFPKRQSWAEDFGITDQQEAESVATLLGGVGSVMHDQTNQSPDSNIPAAYTFFGQFVDHDITLDTTTDLHGDELEDDEVSSLPNLRSPSLDLDCVYGLGPEAMPFLYDQDHPGQMLVGTDANPDDLARNVMGRAIIGDPRNDENLFVSQLQLLFIRFHNRRVAGKTFEEAQKEVRYHYQWLVLHDFLRRVCDEKVFKHSLRDIRKRIRGEGRRSRLVDDCGRICMPVEFAVAAYRFGHSMVRSHYPVNDDHRSIELFSEQFQSLGFGPVPPELVVDWRFLLDVDPGQTPAHSKALDHLLADELIRLPDPVVGGGATTDERSLAFRNLLRGYVLGLPSGQQAARVCKRRGYPVDPGQDLRFGDIAGWGDSDPNLFQSLERHTPLFFYVMREAGEIGKGERLGPVGSAILMELFSTMMVHCDTFFREDGWRPDPEIAGGRELTLADIVRYVEAG